jgi:HPt (histidine-containing phosphotransfer) domain-containing protein
MPGNTEPIDLSVLEAIRSFRREGRPDPLRHIVNLFAEHSRQLIGRMEDALAHGDGAAVRETAHSLKSSSGNVGAVNLSSLCKEMEQAGKEANIDLARRILPQLLEAYEQAGVALEQYLNDHPR